MSNPKYKKKLRKIVLLVVVVVMVILATAGDGTLGENIKNTGKKLSVISELVNDKLSEILGNPSKKIVLTTELENPKVQVHMLDIGQGDCFLIRTPDADILIDAGEAIYYNDIERYLKNLGIEKLDYIIATHPHSDHIGSFADIVNNFEIGQVLFSDVPDELIPTSRSFTNFLEALENKGASIFIAEVGTSYTLGEDTKLTIVGPIGEQTSLNNVSVITRLDCGDISFLFTGDIEKDAEFTLVENRSDLNVDVLAVAHHGSNTSSCEEFLKRSRPSIALISCGVDNGYGHPHKEVMERLSDIDAEVYRTDLDGTVVVETDGKNIAIVCENERSQTDE